MINEKALIKHGIEVLQLAGISPNGKMPWDIEVHNKDFYARVLKHGSLGLGESYMDGWWDCQRIDLLFERLIQAGIDKKITTNKLLFLKLLLYRIFNFQTKKHALEVGKKHYDLGNTLFQCTLDSRMNYTCGYWRNASTLEDAQLDKLKLTCEKLMLKPGMTLLDIGCGFGALAKFAAENFGVKVVGITISEQQYEYAKKNCLGLPIEIRFQDYRDLNEKFDRIASLGMFEHVGYLNYPRYMQIVHQCLQDDGLFLLHTIGSNMSVYSLDEWIKKYIFPTGMLPSIMQIGKSSEGLFIMEDWHNFGADYDKTLMSWHDNFQKNWTSLQEQYDERFYRMWNYYLSSCAGVFRSRDMQLWQIVFSKKGVKGGYKPPRYEPQLTNLSHIIEQVER